MGLFSGIGKAISGLVGGVTGTTAAKGARRAGEQQAQAIMAGLEAQQARIPAALEDIVRGAREAEYHLKPYEALGIPAAQQLMGMAGAPGAAYTPAEIPGAARYAAPTAAEVSMSPAVQFRMEQAQRAAEMGAAARGGLFGGAHQRQLAQYMQGLASQEYEQESARRFREAQLAEQQAMTRAAMAEQQAQFGPQFAEQQLARRMGALQGLTGLGYGAAGDVAGMRERLGAGMAGIRTGSGAAQAAALQSAGQARASGALAGQQARQAGMGGLMQLGGVLGGAALGGPMGGAIGSRLFGGAGGGVPAGGMAVTGGAPISRYQLPYQPQILGAM